MDFPCPRCGALDALVIGQTCHRGALCWHESIRCDQCGLVSEADDNGFPPSMIRDALMRRHGEWVVRLGSDASTVGTARVLRAALSLEMKAALSLARTPSRQVFRGTDVEVVWLKAVLGKAGLSAMVLEIAAGSINR
jgi:hypothetical protein